MEGVLPLARTLCIMVNRECGMRCSHCDLPSQYNTYEKPDLSAEDWNQVLKQIIPVIRPKVIAITAREPLLDRESRDKTRAILGTATANSVSCGLVTNGIHVNEFFQELDSSFRFDFLDISLEGMPDIDGASRGMGHFDTIQNFIQLVPYYRHVSSLFISLTLTALNSSEEHLRAFSLWMTDHFEHPRLALLLLYPNNNVPTRLALDKSAVRRIIDTAISVSSDYEDIFLEIFPCSIPNLYELVENHVLPGSGDVLRDEAGMLCGHVADNLFVRYFTPTDLLRYHLRISPEGLVLTPSGIEKPDYAQGHFGDISIENFSTIGKRVRKELGMLFDMIPTQCLNKRCFEVCRGSNQLCSQLKNDHGGELWKPCLKIRKSIFALSLSGSRSY